MDCPRFIDFFYTSPRNIPWTCLFFVLCLCFPRTALAQVDAMNENTIRGELKLLDFPCDSLAITLADEEYGTNILITDTIRADQPIAFSFIGISEPYRIGSISITNLCSKSGMSMPILLESGELVLEYSENRGFRNSIFPAAPFQNRFQRYNDSLNTLRMEIMGSTRQLNDKNLPESDRKIAQNTLENRSAAATNLIISKWRDHPQEKFSYLFLPLAMKFIDDSPELLDSICRMGSRFAAPAQRATLCYSDSSVIDRSATTLLGSFNEKLTEFLFEHKDEWVVLDFWASWCAPCIADQNKMRAKLENTDRPPFEMVSISLKEDRERSEKSLESRDIGWLNFTDIRGEVAHVFQVSRIPTYVIIDPDGRVRTKAYSMEEVFEFVHVHDTNPRKE